MINFLNKYRNLISLAAVVFVAASLLCFFSITSFTQPFWCVVAVIAIIGFVWLINEFSNLLTENKNLRETTEYIKTNVADMIIEQDETIETILTNYQSTVEQLSNNITDDNDNLTKMAENFKNMLDNLNGYMVAIADDIKYLMSK